MKRRDFLLLGTLALAGCAAQPKSESAAAPLAFSAAERDTIEAYFAQARGRGPANTKPPQQVKPGDLLVSGQRPNKLPVELASKLPHLADPHTRLILGADIILVNRATLRIDDVIPQVAY